MRIEAIEDGLRVLAPAKLNLYLEVGPRRADGFHEIDSIFQSVTLFDELEVRSSSDEAIVLEEEGVSCGDDNLVARAARRLSALSGARRGVRMRLRKRIPQGAGLGGGSSDAAAALVALARLWELRLADAELAAVAAELGSDVPFFLHGGTAICRGRGELVTPLEGLFEPDRPPCYVLVYPRREVSTSLVYNALDASRPPGFALTATELLDSMGRGSVRRQLASRMASGELFFNRLENVVTALFPDLDRVRTSLRAEPFVSVSMSGSGSTFFGVCREAADADRIAASLAERLEADVFSVRAETPATEQRAGTRRAPAEARRAERVTSIDEDTEGEDP